jgi:hypothetical protein
MRPVEPNKIKKDDLMSFVYFTKVKTVMSDGEDLTVENLDDKGKEIHVKGRDLIVKSFSADQFSEERKVSKTQAAQILINSSNRPFTVCFLKGSDKSERTLRGRLLSTEPLLGRSMVEDLDIVDGNRLRQVDHRSIKFLIVDCVKHTVKR